MFKFRANMATRKKLHFFLYSNREKVADEKIRLKKLVFVT